MKKGIALRYPSEFQESLRLKDDWWLSYNKEAPDMFSPARFSGNSPAECAFRESYQGSLYVIRMSYTKIIKWP